MQNKKLKAKKGITLIELLIAITLVGTLTIAFSNIYLNCMKQFGMEFAQTQLQTNSQTVLDRIISDIKGAISVETSYNAYTTNQRTIIMKIPSIDSSQNIIYSGDTMLTDYVIYYFQSESIHRKLIANSASSRYPSNGQDKTIMTEVENLNFTYSPAVPSTSEVTVSMTLEKHLGKFNRTITNSSKTKLRNSL